MKCYTIILLLTFSFCTSILGQKTPSSDNNKIQLLRSLSSNDFEVSYNYIPQLVLGDKALKLIELDKVVVSDLYTMITKNKNTLIAHIILSHIYEVDNLSFSTEYIWNESLTEIIATKHTLNQVSWSVENESSSLDEETIEWVKEYWKNRVK